MYPIEPAGRERGTIRRSFPAPSWLIGLSLFLVLAALASSHAVFPFFPLIPLVLVFFAMRRLGGVAAWRRGTPAVRRTTDEPQALPPNESDKEKELLKALERHGEITATRAALETSLSVAEAEEMLSGLANDGHVRVSANGGTLAYAMWD